MGEGGTSSRSSDMRILVTGASGFVGTALCRELLARGHTVRAAVRRLVPPSAVPPQLHQVLVPDIGAEFDRRALVDGVGAVVHLAAIAHRSNSHDGELRRVNCDAAISSTRSGALRNTPPRADPFWSVTMRAFRLPSWCRVSPACSGGLRDFFPRRQRFCAWRE